MPYLRKTRRKSYRRPGVRPKRKYVRRFAVRRRSAPRTVTKKRILNTSSTKKRDTMQNWTNVGGSGDASSTFKASASLLQGGRTYIMPWICTARSLHNSGGAPNSKFEVASRTSSVCYIRGLAERVQLQTSDGTPWQWRRICFTFKGQSLLSGVVGDGTRQPTALTSSGWMRQTVDWNNSTPAVNPLISQIFRGTQQVDWRSYFNAPIDTNIISVKMDKTRIIQSGNTSGVMRNYKMWLPMNANLHYDDEEVGSDQSDFVLSTPGKPGMGDYYVVDIIASGTGGTSSNILSFDPEATLYWHEK